MTITAYSLELPFHSLSLRKCLRYDFSSGNSSSACVAVTVLHERGNKCCSGVFEIPTALDCFEDGCATKFPCGPGLYQN